LKGPEKIIVQVVLDKPLKDAFDYIWDEAFLKTKPKLGMLVELPFGSSYLVGIVVGVSTHSNRNPTSSHSEVVEKPCQLGKGVRRCSDRQIKRHKKHTIPR